MKKFEGDKHNPDSYHIEHGDFSTKKALSGFSIEESGASRPDAPKYNYSVSFDLSKGGLPSSENDPDRLKQTVTNLLDAASIENYEFKRSINGRDFSVEVKGAEAGMLTKVAGALSSNVNLEDGKTIHAVIDKDVAIRIADLEAEATGQDVDAYSITRDEFSEPGVEYVTYSSNIPGSAVTAVQQDGQSAAIAGQKVRAEKTRILIDPASKSAVAKALRDVNADFTAGQGVIQVNDPIHEVSKALTLAGLLPQSAGAKIATEFAEVRSSFARVSEVRDDTPRAMAVLSAKAVMGPSGAS